MQLTGLSALSATLLLLGCSGEVSISNLRIEELTATRALARFETSDPTSCWVEYGSAGGAREKIATDPDMAPGQTSLTHRVPLEDLRPDTAYDWVARVETAGGSIVRSLPLSFRTSTSTATAQGTNVALMASGARVVEVSSNWAHAQNDGAFGANLAFDGQMSTEWSTHGDGDHAFVALDLGQVRALHRIGFRSRQMSDGSSIIRSFRVSVEGGPELGPYETPDPNQRYEFRLSPAVNAQRLRITAVTTSGGNTGAKEIELWSEP